MEFKYEVGQYVYTAETIRGWFDYSMEDHIPANTVGRIIKRSITDEGPYYILKFEGKNKDFGTQWLSESELKLG